MIGGGMIMSNPTISRFAQRRTFASALVAGALVLAPCVAAADEGGVSFWVPGFFGSLAATPQQPGFSLAIIYYHTSVSAGRGDEFVRGGAVVAGLDARANLGFVAPSYVFATPVFGAQASVALLIPFGHVRAAVDATLTGPRGNTVSLERSDEVTGFGDLAPQFALRWNAGVHNFLAYVTGDVPVGDYQAGRLANLGIGHWAIDAGGGYTYFNPQTGHELSGVLGFTYNFKNPATDYQNGVDMHFDWGASQFLTKQWQVGLVGYAFQQISDDTGSGARLGGFRSRVFGVGPQIGYVFPLGDHQGYLNLKGYKEFGAENRPEGWNVWLTFVISPAAAPPPAARKPIVTKY
jgi:hypothetical protein